MAHYMPINTTVHQEAKTVLKILESVYHNSVICWTTQNTARHIHNCLQANGAFKSCRLHHIYELNAHERHQKVVTTSGKLQISFKPRVSRISLTKALMLW